MRPVNWGRGKDRGLAKDRRRLWAEKEEICGKSGFRIGREGFTGGEGASTRKNLRWRLGERGSQSFSEDSMPRKKKKELYEDERETVWVIINGCVGEPTLI